MESIEEIKTHIKMLEEDLELTIEEFKPYVKCQIEKYKNVLKDLKDLEIVKNWIIETVANCTDDKHPKYLIDNFIYDNDPIFNIIDRWVTNEE